MSRPVRDVDLAGLSLASGSGRALDLDVELGSFELSGERYEAMPAPAPMRLDVSRTTAAGYALRLRFEAALLGPCMRCLEQAEMKLSVDLREVEQPGAEDERLDSPYVQDSVVALTAWARDGLLLEVGPQLLCRADCAGLCAVCGENLNAAAEHVHAAEPDPRWAKLRELEL